MSMNIWIMGERKIFVPKTESFDTQTVKFDAWQTPTKVTHAILASEDKLQAYKDWVLSITKEEQIPVYAPGDIFGEKDPIGMRPYHSGKEHIADLDYWVEHITSQGYTLDFSEI